MTPKSMNNRYDFEQQWERRRKESTYTRCPLSNSAIEEAIGKAMHAPTTIASQPLHSTSRMQWLRPMAVAAVLAAVAVPSVMFALHDNSLSGTVRNVSIGNQQVRFACNNGCSAEGVVSMFDRQIHRS